MLNLARTQIGVIESKENWGPQIQEYLDSCGFKVPVPWCACYVTWVYKCLGFNVPNSPAWSPSWLNKRYADKRSALPGDVGLIWYNHLNRVGHTILIEETNNEEIISIEGNTNLKDSRDGDKVMRKIRPWDTLYATSNYLDKRYKVQPGDNLYRIALNNGTTVDTLIALNNLRGNTIHVGQLLLISC